MSKQFRLVKRTLWMFYWWKLLLKVKRKIRNKIKSTLRIFSRNFLGTGDNFYCLLSKLKIPEKMKGWPRHQKLTGNNVILRVFWIVKIQDCRSPYHKMHRPYILLRCTSHTYLRIVHWWCDVKPQTETKGLCPTNKHRYIIIWFLLSIAIPYKNIY